MGLMRIEEVGVESRIVLSVLGNSYNLVEPRHTIRQSISLKNLQ